MREGAFRRLTGAAERLAGACTVAVRTLDRRPGLPVQRSHILGTVAARAHRVGH